MQLGKEHGFEHPYWFLIKWVPTKHPYTYKAKGTLFQHGVNGHASADFSGAMTISTS